jgi:hypothetical protein
VGGGHAGGRGGRAAYQESVLGVKRRGGGPKGGPRWWGAELSGAGCSGRGRAGEAVQLWAEESKGGAGQGQGSAAGLVARGYRAAWGRAAAEVVTVREEDRGRNGISCSSSC